MYNHIKHCSDKDKGVANAAPTKPMMSSKTGIDSARMNEMAQLKKTHELALVSYD